MSEHVLVMLAAMLAAGFLCQWLAWRIRLPAILPLLLIGLLLGPALGWLDPDALLGDILFPAVSIAVAIILFEGSVNLRFTELAGIGHAVRGLVSYGALIALLLLAVAAHYIGGLGWELSFLFGAVTCVTGPTVVQPLLRTVRPNQRVSNLLRWEGIIIDPIGALLAVLVYEAIISREEGHSLWVFATTIGCGALIGGLFAAITAFLLRRHYIPEFLQSYGTLAMVVAAFALSNSLTAESGLLAVTVMGIVLGNVRDIHMDDILDFKENLSTVLVSVLFIVLAARMPWPLPDGVLLAGLLLYLVAQFVIRPVSVGVATLGSQLNWRERLLACWISPRGVVAAAVSALFALRLADRGIAGAELLVPLVFLLILCTVIVQSASSRAMAVALDVAEPEPNGILVFGSDRLALVLSEALVEQEVQVLLASDEWNIIRAARMQGIPTYYGNPTSQHADRHLDLTGIGRLLAMSTHREQNSLACLHYRQEFGRDRVYRLRNLTPEQNHERNSLAGSLLAPPLFADDMTHDRMLKMLANGWSIKSTQLTDSFDWDGFTTEHGSSSIMLFAIGDKGMLRIASTKRTLEPKAGWTVTALVPPESSTPQAA